MNGGLTLWIDGVQQADLTGADNDTWRVDRARLGALSGIDAGTSGIYYFDAFESRRSSYIGPLASAPSLAQNPPLPFALSGVGRVDGALPSYRDHFASYRIEPRQQGGSLTFTPLDDAHIQSANPTNNYGSATELQVDQSPVKHFLLKFDVSGVNGQTITNARLRLYNVDAAGMGGKFYHVADDTWQEETVTWNNAPVADTTLLAQLGAVSLNTWYEVDVTSLVTGDGVYSFRISDSQGGADYSSKEGAHDPELVLTFGGTSTPTNTPTPGPSPTPTKTPTPTATSVATNTPTATPTPAAPFNSAIFVYDGDGRRVKSIFNGTTTTYFVGAHYEVTGSTITKYYYAGAQRIAMRTNGSLNYLLGDHLGSTSLTTNASGQVVSEIRYKAWGETRYAAGPQPSRYQYTGQLSYEPEFGLMYYGARWYDSSLGRFVQADTIIPEQSQGVQAWDRYAYVSNNPVRYNDPTGHCPLCLTAVIGGAVGGIVGAVGYTAYVAASGREFNSSHFWMATGGGAVAGALIGTGVGIAAGVSVASATTAAVEAGAVVEGANVACGGDMCAGELQDASKNIQLACGGDCSDEVSSAGNALSSQAQSLLNELPTAGSNTSVPSGQINSSIMAELQHATGDEFALIRAQGERLLVRGGLGNVQLPAGVTRIIAHTHPWGASTVPSRLDISALQALGQRWSLIISEYGSVAKFLAHNE